MEEEGGISGPWRATKLWNDIIRYERKFTRGSKFWSDIFFSYPMHSPQPFYGAKNPQFIHEFAWLWKENSKITKHILHKDYLLPFNKI